MGGLRVSFPHVTLVMGSSDVSRDQYFTSQADRDRDRQLGTEDTENKAVYSIYVGEKSLTLREHTGWQSISVIMYGFTVTSF